MNKERTVITQQLCDHVKALLAGKLTHKKAAEFTGIGKATVDRIVAAGFNAEQYAKNTAAKKEEKEKKQAEEQKPAVRYGCVYTGHIEMPQTGIELTPEGPVNRETITMVREELKKFTDENQVPGQMEMDLQPEEELEAKVYPELKAKRDERIMRFQSKQVDKIRADIQSTQYENLKAIYDLRVEMHTIRDLLGQILRRKDK